MNWGVRNGPTAYPRRRAEAFDALGDGLQGRVELPAPGSEDPIRFTRASVPIESKRARLRPRERKKEAPWNTAPLSQFDWVGRPEEAQNLTEMPEVNDSSLQLPLLTAAAVPALPKHTLLATSLSFRPNLFCQ